MEDKTVLVYCKLCKVAFLKNEMTRVVTVNMLKSLKHHLNKRGNFYFDSFLTFSKGESNLTCWVCDLCFQLVIAEQELVKTETKLAECMSIPMKKEEDKALKLSMSDRHITVSQL